MQRKYQLRETTERAAAIAAIRRHLTAIGANAGDADVFDYALRAGARQAQQPSDHEAVVTALADIENAVNRSVSGINVDIGEWLKLIQQARVALGKRVKE